MEITVKKQQGKFLVDAQFVGGVSGVTALFGPSGAGKTSIINMVAGLSRPDYGRIAVNGLCLFDSASGINLPPEKRRIGYVFQDGRLLPHLSVRANLVYGMHRVPKKQRFVKFNHIVDLLGIDHLIHRRPAGLSGGEKQRVAIGRAMLTSPAILLMDEPLASIDAGRKAEVMPFIMRLAEEFAIPTLYVTHSMDEILNLATHIVIMENGHVRSHGLMEDTLSHPSIQSFFNQDDKGTVLPAKVETPMDSSGLTRLKVAGHILKIQPIQASAGSTVRLRIPSRYVALSLNPPDQSSFQNIFPGTVAQIVDQATPFVDIRIDIGCDLWARITRQALEDLKLRTGQHVFALIKSVAVSSGYSDVIKDI